MPDGEGNNTKTIADKDKDRRTLTIRCYRAVRERTEYMHVCSFSFTNLQRVIYKSDVC